MSVIFRKMIVGSLQRNHQNDKRVPSWIKRQRVYSSILYRNKKDENGTCETEIQRKEVKNLSGMTEIQGKEVKNVPGIIYCCRR